MRKMSDEPKRTGCNFEGGGLNARKNVKIENALNESNGSRISSSNS